MEEGVAEKVSTRSLTVAERTNLKEGIKRANRILRSQFGEVLEKDAVGLYRNMPELARLESEGIQLDITILGSEEDSGSQLAVALSIYHERLHDILKGKRGREALTDEERFQEEVFVE